MCVYDGIYALASPNRTPCAVRISNSITLTIYFFPLPTSKLAFVSHLDFFHFHLATQWDRRWSRCLMLHPHQRQHRFLFANALLDPFTWQSSSLMSEMHQNRIHLSPTKCSIRWMQEKEKFIKSLILRKCTFRGIRWADCWVAEGSLCNSVSSQIHYINKILSASLCRHPRALIPPFIIL